MHQEADATQHELSRLKWLLANRSARSDAADALGPAYDAGADRFEAETLQELIKAVARGLC